MAKIDKLINKINKVKSAVNSLKGISAKIQSLDYTTEIDKLKENKTKALRDLATRNAALEKINDRSGFINSTLKTVPTVQTKELVYPVHDELSNYLVFDIRDRKVGSDTDAEANTIALYIPDELISQSSVSYGTKDVGPLAKVFSGVLDEFANPTGDVGGTAVAGLQKVTQLGAQKIKDFLTGGISSIKAGVAINPNKETTLNPLEFRTFSFNYEFNPRSEQEAEVVRQIIHTFRLSMLPDSLSDKKGNVAVKNSEQESNLSEFDAFFTFPNIFDIYFDGPIGDKIDGFLPAVCTSAEVNYTGGQKFATHYDGQPVKVSLSLAFQEIRVMNRSNYKEISAYENDDLTKRNLASPDESIVDNTNG
jgi:hypothetical protein